MSEHREGTLFYDTETGRYAIVLSSSYHPELLVDGGARNLFFYSLANGNLQNQRSRSLIEYEIEDLLSGDIPYFYFRGSKKNIYTWDGREVKDFFSNCIASASY